MAKIFPHANARPTRVRAAGTVTSGTFGTLGAGGVSAATADTQEIFGVIAEDAVVGDMITVWTDGDFEVDTVGDLDVGVRVEFASASAVQAHAGVTSKSCGFTVGYNPASAARAVIRLVTVFNGTVVTL